MALRKVREYALHIRKDGVEVLFRRLPEFISNSALAGGGLWQGVPSRKGGYVPVHHIVVLELEDGSLVEETTISCFEVVGSPPAITSIICPRPHGPGWKLHNGESDKHAVWRRPMPTGERAIFDHPDHE